MEKMLLIQKSWLKASRKEKTHQIGKLITMCSMLDNLKTTMIQIHPLMLWMQARKKLGQLSSIKKRRKLRNKQLLLLLLLNE